MKRSPAWMLKRLEQAYGCPVDIEFAHDGEAFHLLQCRPLAIDTQQAFRLRRLDQPVDVDLRCEYEVGLAAQGSCS